MLLVAGLANTKWGKTHGKWLKPWHICIHPRVHSYTSSLYIYLCIFVVASALEGLITVYLFLYFFCEYKHSTRYDVVLLVQSINIVYYTILYFNILYYTPLCWRFDFTAMLRSVDREECTIWKVNSRLFYWFLEYQLSCPRTTLLVAFYW